MRVIVWSVVASLAVVGCSGPAVTPSPDAGPALDASGDRPPIANAGGDRAAPRGTSVVLDGRGSYDPDGAPLTFAWLLVATPPGSAAVLTGADTATPTLVVDVVGAYEVSLVVNDGGQPSAPDTARIAVTEGEPVADAGADVSAAIGETVTLDGTGSMDPDGDPLAYAWTLVSAPPGSTAALAGADTATPSLRVDVPGVFAVRLDVDDGHGPGAPDVVVVTGVNHAPTANAGADVELPLGATATLDGSASGDIDGDPVTYAWAVTTRPAGSVAQPASPTGVTTAFTPDAAGTYALTLTVDDGHATTRDTVTVLVEGAVVDVGGALTDAEYSAALDRVVLLPAGLPRLDLVDPAAGTVQQVALPLRGASLSLSPDGTEAIVGHNGWISVIDLATATLAHTWPVAVPVGDAIDGGNGWAYVLPAADQWVAVHSIDLATGADTVEPYSIYAGSVGRRAPGASAIYVLDRGLSPSNAERHGIGGGAAVFEHRSPYWGDYPYCGDLWFSEDGARMFTACGNVFHTTADPAADLTYAGSLELSVRSVAHSGAAGVVVAVPHADSWTDPDADAALHLFSDPFLAGVGTIALPPLLADHALATTHGDYVFVDAAGATIYVLGHVGTSTREVLWSTAYP